MLTLNLIKENGTFIVFAVVILGIIYLFAKDHKDLKEIVIKVFLGLFILIVLIFAGLYIYDEIKKRKNDVDKEVKNKTHIESKKENKNLENPSRVQLTEEKTVTVAINKEYSTPKVKTI